MFLAMALAAATAVGGATERIDRSICVVHRGWGLVMPENSIPALEKCWSAGFLPECDARISTDGVLYAFHDPKYRGRPMKDLSWAEVQEIDIGEPKGPAWKGKGLRAPTWDAIFTEMAKDPKRCILMDHKDAPMKTLAEMVRKYGVSRQAWWCQGSIEACAKWKALVPDGRALVWIPFGRSWKSVDFADTARLSDIDDFVKNRIAEWEKIAFGAADVVELIVNVDVKSPDRTSPSLAVIKDAVGRIRAAGKKACLMVWAQCADHVESYRSLYNAVRPDCFGTDYPERLQEFLAEDGASSTATEARYGFTFFRGNGEDGVFLATSADGFNWTEANGGKPILPAVLDDRITRDPSVCVGSDGHYHMVFTTSWKHQGFGVAHSPDLRSWTRPEFIPVNEDWPEAKNTWAPEISWDPETKCYFVVWATSTTTGKGRYHRQYCVTTRDFRSWTPRRLYYDPGHSVIDAFPFRFKGRWTMLVKDETHEPVRHWLQVVRSKGGAFGPWDAEEKNFTDNAEYWAEGPTALELADGRWVVYFDCYSKRRYGAFVTRDFEHFERVDFSLPKGLRHGTAFRLIK